jgi:hypothetical protein
MCDDRECWYCFKDKPIIWCNLCGEVSIYGNCVDNTEKIFKTCIKCNDLKYACIKCFADEHSECPN